MSKMSSSGGVMRAFVGESTWNERSVAESLHEAVQDAAYKAAQAGLRPERITDREGVEGEGEWFEVSRVQIVVGNPNVKVYRVVITPTSGV